MPKSKKIDPLNKKLYGSVSTMLTVTDIKAAATFYQKAFGFEKRAMMNGPDGKPIHAELTLRGTTSTKDRHANYLVYTGTKAAIDMMTSLMSIELGPRGIRVNAISPGMTPTEGLNALGIPQSPFRKIIEAKTPLGRIGTVEDSASATLFLASEKASWITGENLFVAGGVQ